MSNKKTEFQVTIGYKAVVCFNVKADDAEAAKKMILDKVREKGIYDGELQDETYSAAGILNLDDSWNMVNG